MVALLQHRVYRDSYATQESWLHETNGTHGPFIIDRLRPTDFEEIPFATLQRSINARFRDPTFDAPPSEDQTRAVLRFVEGLPSEERRCYRLTIDLDDERYRHEISHVHMVFDEYLVIGPAGRVLWMLILGYD